MENFFLRRREKPSGAQNNTAPVSVAAGSGDSDRIVPTEHAGAHRKKHERIRFFMTGIIATAIFAAVGLWGEWAVAPAAGWAVATIFHSVDIRARIGWMGPDETEAHAAVEDPSRAVREVLVLSANVISLAAVVLLIVEVERIEGWTKLIFAVIALVAVASSWVLLHTIYTLRYAECYYGSNPPGGIDFGSDDFPSYLDFAYFSFTIGMTYAPADSVTSSEIRQIVFGHAIMSFLFGTGILATAISLVVGLF